MSGPLEPADRTRLVALARASILRAVDGAGPAVASADGAVPGVGDASRADLSAALWLPRAAFVSLKGGLADGDGRRRLRGCIGDLGRRHPLWRTVERVAARAATEDPRFPPVTPEELAGLELEISVLGDSRPSTLRGEPVPGRHGVELVLGTHRGIFLPQVAAELGWSREELLRQVSLKAGLDETGWRVAELRVFEAEAFGGPLTGSGFTLRRHRRGGTPHHDDVST